MAAALRPVSSAIFLLLLLDGEVSRRPASRIDYQLETILPSSKTEAVNWVFWVVNQQGISGSSRHGKIIDLEPLRLATYSFWSNNSIWMEWNGTELCEMGGNRQYTEHQERRAKAPMERVCVFEGNNCYCNISLRAA